MALVVKDRVKETTATTGTGTLTLAGAVTGFQSFSSALSDGDTTYYAIFESSTGEWEVGLGTFTASGTTLARTTILASSNSGSAVNLTAGAADVFITQPAGKAAYFDGSGDLNLTRDPQSALQAATKQYVDTIAAAGIHYHTPVRVESPSNLTATYDNGTAGVGATLTNSGTQAALVIDGITLSTSDRVLVYNQTNAAHNGIYTVTNTGSASTNWVLTRATDADSYGPSDPDALGEGDAFFVSEGDTGAGELYVMNTSGTITFGTTNITFAIIAETAVYSAGNGLTLTGTTFAVGAGTGVTVNANDVAIGQAVGTTDNVTFNQVTAALVGNVTGNVSGSSGSTTGNAATATKLATSRTISLTGDVTGSASFDGSANASIAATIAADSVALGTDTTGNYVATGAVSGNGLSGSASAEGATFTVTSNATNANTASTIVFRDASGNFSAGTITAALNGNASTATSATNADTVDSLHASQFLRSDANDTTTGQLTVDNDNGVKVVYGTETTNIYYTGYGMDSHRGTTYIRPSNDNTQTLYIGGSGSANDWANISLKVGNNNNVNINGNTVWHAGNDGSGSGLDADTVDGLQASSFLRSDASDTYTSGTLTFSNGTALDLATNDAYANLRVVKSSNSSSPGLFVGYANAGSGNTILYGGGSTSPTATVTSSSIEMQENHYVNLRFEVDPSSATSVAYIILCRNAANNDVNGTITMDRTSGLRFACSWDIIVSSGSSTTPIGSLVGHSLAGAGQPSARLVTLTYSSVSYVALELTNPDQYYETTGAYFNGRIVNSGSNTFTVVTAGQVSAISSMYISTSRTIMSNNLEVGNSIIVPNQIIHDGDDDTNISFGTDTITLNVGGTPEITVNTTGVRLGDTGNGYFQPVTGDYGSIQIDGGAHGSHEGYSIGGRAVFMHDNASRMGLYDDVNNEWGFIYDFNSAAQIFYNGSSKLQTTSSGINVTGTAEVDTLTFSDGSSQTSAGASTGKAIAMAIVFG